MPTDACSDDNGSTQCDSASLDEGATMESEWTHISDGATDALGDQSAHEGLWEHIDEILAADLQRPLGADTHWSCNNEESSEGVSDSSEDPWWDFHEAPPAQINPHSEIVDPPAQIMIIKPHSAVWDRIAEIWDRNSRPPAFNAIVEDVLFFRCHE